MSTQNLAKFNEYSQDSNFSNFRVSKLEIFQFSSFETRDLSIFEFQKLEIVQFSSFETRNLSIFEFQENETKWWGKDIFELFTPSQML